MYKFFGKKGRLYDIDPNEIIMKLNYRCPKDKYGEGYSCGNTPEERKKNYDKQQKGNVIDKKSFITTEIKTSKDYKNASLEAKLAFLNSEIEKGHQSATLPDGSRLSNIKGKARELSKKIGSSVEKTSTSNIKLETKQLVTETKSIIQKVKKEKASGKVSKETKEELKTAISKIKKDLPTSSTSTLSEDSKLTKITNTSPKNFTEFIDNSNNIIYNEKKVVDSLKEYVDSSFRMNTFLRTKPVGAKVRDKHITALTETLDKSIVPKGTTLFRGVSPIQWETLPKEPGQTYIDKNFVSTTSEENIGIGFGKYGFIQDVKKERLKNSNEYIKNGRFDWDKMKPYLLEIRVNDNTKGLSLEKFVDKEFPNDEWVVGGNGEIADTGNQKEVLLQRSQKYRVVGTKEYKDHTRLIIETYNE